MAETPNAAPTTVGRLLDELTEELTRRGVHDPRRGAETLLSRATGVPHAQLQRHADSTTDAHAARLCRDWVAQTSADAPVAYLVGQAPFFDRDFEVTRDTLIPKRDTELFLEIVFAQIAEKPLPSEPHVLELCCGSGCVAITLADRIPGAKVIATDISEAALNVARHNVERHGFRDRVTLGLGDLFEPVEKLWQGWPFDLIVSNPPYIPTENIPGMGAHVAEHEPRLALDGGEDGLNPHRRILQEGAKFLAPGGRVFLEHEWYHGEAGRDLARSLPDYTDVRTFQDANGKDRALFCQRR